MPASVLLIDDDVDVLRSIGNYFERLGYEVTRELSGEAGLATFDRLRPEVVVLDRERKVRYRGRIDDQSGRHDDGRHEVPGDVRVGASQGPGQCRLGRRG